MMFLPIGQIVLRTSSKPSTYLTFRICNDLQSLPLAQQPSGGLVLHSGEQVSCKGSQVRLALRERPRKGSGEACVSRADLRTCGGLFAARSRLHCSGEDVGG